MKEPTNEDRANRAYDMLQTYCHRLEGRDFKGDEDDVTDALTDIMHMTNLQYGIDFEACLRRAREHFEAEK